MHEVHHIQRARLDNDQDWTRARLDNDLDNVVAKWGTRRCEAPSLDWLYMLQVSVGDGERLMGYG